MGVVDMGTDLGNAWGRFGMLADRLSVMVRERWLSRMTHIFGLENLVDGGPISR